MQCPGHSNQTLCRLLSLICSKSYKLFSSILGIKYLSPSYRAIIGDQKLSQLWKNCIGQNNFHILYNWSDKGAQVCRTAKWASLQPFQPILPLSKTSALNQTWIRNSPKFTFKSDSSLNLKKIQIWINFKCELQKIMREQKVYHTQNSKVRIVAMPRAFKLDNLQTF